MAKHFSRIFISVFILASFSNSSLLAQSSNTLWYRQPASYFEESLVLGNGKTGASVFGGVASDKIFLNDATLWTGEPVQANMNPEAYKNLPAIRAALKAGNYKLADSLNHTLQGKFSESYAPLGTLFFEWKHDGPFTNYRRELNIGEAVSTTSYEVNGVHFKREYFISHPDQVMVIRLSADRKAALRFRIRFESQLRYKTSSAFQTLAANGYAPVHAEPSYRGNMPNPVVFDENRGTRFTTLIDVKNTDGSVSRTDSTLELDGATEVIVRVAITTSFNGFDKNPVTQGRDNRALAANALEAASKKSYTQLKATHLSDYKTYFDRVRIRLDGDALPDIPTDERLKRYNEGKEDRDFETLYFQYGRYLLISSSRTEGVPANLQGIWNPYIRPPWSSNYTLNINAEENYWLAENANLSEMHNSLLSFIERISATGAITAKTFYGVNGWTACHNSDIWAMSNPVGDFGKGDPAWANWNMGGAWLSTHLWEHYLFTRDPVFLRNKAYPLIRGATQFCLEWLVEDDKGQLITSPSTSPENIYIAPDGYKGATMFGGTADLAMIRELFTDYLSAAKALKVTDAFTSSVEQALQRLHPYMIGAKGNLQEWYYDWEDAEPQHRHQSHLFGLHPGHQITTWGTPALAQACRKTLEIKGDETTGWSKGWRINLWARLGDGNHAYKMLRELLHDVEPDAKVSYSQHGGTYPNLFDAHPPFQIDGNFGGAAAFIEMLVQSDENEIRLLPALPDAWAKGSADGLCARGGFVLNMQWANRSLTKLSVYSREGGNTVLRYNGKEKKISMRKGEHLEVTL